MSDKDLNNIVDLSHSVAKYLNEWYVSSARIGSVGAGGCHVNITRRTGFFSGPSVGKLFFDPSGQVVVSFTEDATPEEQKLIEGILPVLNKKFAKAE